MSEEGPILLSVIIVNWNTRDLLQRCLDSVYATVPPLRFELLVVDNASEDGSADMVAERFPEATLIRSASNLGFAAGNNVGLRKASGRYVMLLNPDTELLPGAVGELIRFGDAHPEAGLVGPKLLNPDGSLQESGRMFPSMVREALRITRLYRLMWRTCDRTMQWGREDFDRTVEVDEVTGACMLVRRSALDAVGLLDERFFMYYEDVDWCLRMKQTGWKVYYYPDARVVHHWAQGVKQLGLLVNHILYRSQYLYFRKHHGLGQALVLRFLSWLFLIALHTRALLRR